MVFKLLFMAMMLGSCSIAFWQGRESERWTATALMLAALASPLVESSVFMHAETGILMIDLLLLGFLLVLAMRSDRFWPLWAAGFQIVGTSIHVARIVDPTIWPTAYATAQIFWSYPILLALIAGTMLEARYREA